MKNKTSKILFLISILLALVIGCQYDEIVEHQHYQENVISVKKVHLKDLLVNQKFNNSFSKLKNVKSKIVTDLANRSSMEDSFNFTIVDSTVKIMSDNNNTYYTLRIETDNKTDQKLENLVLLEETDTETIGYIIKYNTLATENKSEQEIIDTGFSEILPITVQNTESSNKVMVITYTYSLCDGDPDYCNDSGYCCKCGFGTGIMTIEVPEFGDDNGDQSNGNYNPYGGYDGSGGYGTPSNGDPNDPTQPSDGCKGCGNIYTTPVFEDEIDNEKTPCSELNKMTGNSNIKNTYTGANGLNSKVNDAKEHGYAFRRGNNYDTFEPCATNLKDPARIIMPSGGDIYGGSHTHPHHSTDNGYVSMFPAPDINYLYGVATQFNWNGTHPSRRNYAMFVLTLTVPNGTYAIKIKDVMKFFGFMNFQENMMKCLIK